MALAWCGESSPCRDWLLIAFAQPHVMRDQLGGLRRVEAPRPWALRRRGPGLWW
jgi:hypothetical protein